MRHAALRSILIASSFLIGLSAAPLALAGETHGYPPTVHSTVETSEQGWSSERASSDEQVYAERRDEETLVGYLPLSFFGDAGGVGPFPVDYGYGGGGGYAYAAGGATAGGFASAHASASVSASVSVTGGFRGRGGGYSHGGGHGCGCK